MVSLKFRPHCGPGVDSASNRNEYQEYFLGGKDGRCIGLTTLPPSCANCLEIWEPQPPGTLRACRPVMGLLYLYLYLTCHPDILYLREQEWEDQWLFFEGKRGPRANSFLNTRHMKMVRLSALGTGRLCPPPPLLP